MVNNVVSLFNQVLESRQLQWSHGEVWITCLLPYLDSQGTSLTQLPGHWKLLLLFCFALRLLNFSLFLLRIDSAQKPAISKIKFLFVFTIENCIELMEAAWGKALFYLQQSAAFMNHWRTLKLQISKVLVQLVDRIYLKPHIWIIITNLHVPKWVGCRKANQRIPPIKHYL